LRDQTAKGRSSDADFVNFTSILPVADSVGYEYAANQHVTLASLLLERDYHTISAIPFTPTFWNRQVTQPAYGFQVNLFRSDFELRREDKIGWGLNDLEFVRQMAPRIAGWPRPFCGWLTTLSLHYPYSEFPDRQKVLDLGAWEGTSLGNYLHGMSLFDRAFGELMANLESEGLLEETVVALWGDHDSTLVRRRELADVLEVDPREPGRFLMDRVPLLIWVPGEQGPKGEREMLAGHTDIAPTLLALLGVDPAHQAFVGRNLLGTPGTAPMLHPKGNWESERWVYLNEGRGLENGSCWDRQTLEEVAVASCGPGNHQAERTLEISERVLLYDLQQRITDRLRQGSSAGAGAPDVGTAQSQAGEAG
jgi:phosphoglycerol transferase MdoB-like AlkP superfamily enzyme